MNWKKIITSATLLVAGTTVFLTAQTFQNAEITYSAALADFSDDGIEVKIEDDAFLTVSPAELKPNDVFVDIDGNAKKVVSITRSGKTTIIQTQDPGIQEAIESLIVPKQTVTVGTEDATSRSSKELLNKSLEVSQKYPRNNPMISFSAGLNFNLSAVAEINIPVVSKKGYAKAGLEFGITLDNAKLNAALSKSYTSDRISLAACSKGTFLKLKTDVITQTIANGAITLDSELYGTVKGGVVFEAVLERRLFRLPLPVNCGITREFSVNMNETLKIKADNSDLEQMLGIDFQLTVLGIQIAKASSCINPYIKAGGNLDYSIGFTMGKDLKPVVTEKSNSISANCELGINTDTSIRLIKDLYKKDFGKNSFVIFKYTKN